MKNLSKAIALVGAMTASTAAFAEGHEGHSVEVAASAGVATSYLFRGAQLGTGAPMVYGDLMASYEGVYGGIWVAGGDDELGTEYDLILGYGGEAGDVSYDINLVNFVYTDAGVAEKTDVFDYTEVTLGLGYAGASFSYTTPITGGEYDYITLGYGAGDFSATLGYTDADGTKSTHLDIAYAANDNITFIASQVIDNDEEADDDIIFVVDYALPL